MRYPVNRTSLDPFVVESDMGPPKIDLPKILEEQVAKKKKVVKPKPASTKTVMTEKVLNVNDSKSSDTHQSIPKPTPPGPSRRPVKKVGPKRGPGRK